MKKNWILPILIGIIILGSWTVKAKDLHVLILGQYQGQFETMMINSYRSANYLTRIISIPPGSVFLDGESLLQQQQIQRVLKEYEVMEVAKALGEYFDMEITNYIIVDYDGAQGVVDAMGGVNFNLPYVFRLPPLDGMSVMNLSPGPQLFNGQTARRFLRYRTGDLYGPDELKVIELQQLFLDAMIRQLSREKKKIFPVAWQLPKMIKTNLGLIQILNLAVDAVQMDPDELDVKFGIIPGKFLQKNGVYQYQIKGARGYRLP